MGLAGNKKLGACGSGVYRVSDMPGPVPPYGQRNGWIPRTLTDYGGGGAFPEIHVAQYPLDMGRKGMNETALILSSSLDAEGKNEFSKIAEYGHRKDEIVYSQFKDLVPRNVEYKDEDLARPDAETEAEIAARTRAALSEILDTKIAARTTSNSIQKKEEPTYVKYTPNPGAIGHNPNVNQRIIRIVETQSDPLEPPKFKHKKLARGPGSPPVPVLRSPPRKLTVKDMENWKIPPCISNWKNAKGYTIPLDKRLASDGHNLEEHVISDGFAKLSEALLIAERKNKEEIALRDKIRRQLLLKEKEAKEEELRQLALHAREERTHAAETLAPVDEEEVRRREEIREERARERERDRRMEAAGKKTKLTRDRDRDISEKIALGMAPRGAAAEAQYDERLFNQSAGLGSGFGAEDSYGVYDKPLFAGSSAQQVYRPKRGEDEVYGGTEEVESVLKTARFKPDRGFAGTETVQPTGPRTAPVEFEKDAGDDPFGLGQFLDDAKKASGRKDALAHIGKQGGMSAAGGSATGAADGRKRKMDFD